MIKKLLIITIALTLQLIAQSMPEQFRFDDIKLSKTSDSSPASNSIERIWVDGNNIWLGTGKGLSRSTDNGLTWKNYYSTPEFDKDNVYAVKANNGIVWAGKWQSQNISGQDIPVGTGICYSTNNGETWIKIDQPKDNLTDTVITYGINKLRATPIATFNQNMVRDFGFTKDAVWLASWGGGLRKSTDNGQTWQRVVLPPKNLNSIKPTDTLNFVINPSVSLNYYVFSILIVKDTIYVGTADGINKSTDGGVSWTKFNRANQQKPITGNFIWSMSYNEFDNSIWACTWKADDQSETWGVSRSTNGGKSWEQSLYDERVYDIGIKYLGTRGNFSGSEIFAATENGIYRSSNNGITWINAPSIIDAVTKKTLTTRKFRSLKVNRQSNIMWGGSLNGLVKYEEANGFWQGDWTIYLTSDKIQTTSESYAFPNPFTPSKEVVRIKYKTEQPADVTIRIFDFGMNLIKTVIQNSPRDARDELLETWDGKDESGRVVPNGVYFYRIDIGSNDPLFGKIMVLM